jgi:hypothetical protein
VSAVPDDANEALLAAMFAYFKPCQATTVRQAIAYYRDHPTELGDPGHNASVMGLELGSAKDDAELSRVFRMMEKQIGDWEIVSSSVTPEQKSTGFFAYVLEKPNHSGYVAAIRGSNGEEEDWYDNGKTATETPTEQQQAAEEWLSELPPKYTNLFLTGHSKGGNNVQYLAYENPDGRVAKAYEFDGQGLSRGYVDSHQLAPGVELRGFADSMDYVSALGEKRHDVTFIQPGGEELHMGVLWHHYAGTMLDEPGELRGTTSPGWNHKIVRALSDAYEYAIGAFPGPFGEILACPISVIMGVIMAEDKWEALIYCLGKTGETCILAPTKWVTGLLAGLLGSIWGPAGDLVKDMQQIMTKAVNYIVDTTIAVIQTLTAPLKKVAQTLWAGIAELGSSIIGAVSDFCSAIGGLFGFGSKKKSKPLNLNEPIFVDTGRLLQAADRIRGVQRRLDVVDHHLDTMRRARQADLIDRITNLVAEAEVGRDPVLEKVANYLTETATSFDEGEVKLARRVAEQFAT